MKISNISAFTAYLGDLKSGKLNSHQPKRSKFNSKWFVLQRIKEGNPLKQI